MFNFSGSEIVFLLLLALIILGPEKLPDAIRKFGKTYAEFKKVTTGFQTELKQALDEPMREMRETAEMLKKAATFDVVNPMEEAASVLKSIVDPSPDAVEPTSTVVDAATDASGAAPPLASAAVASSAAAADDEHKPFESKIISGGQKMRSLDEVLADTTAATAATADMSPTAAVPEAPTEPARPAGPVFHSAAPPVRPAENTHAAEPAQPAEITEAGEPSPSVTPADPVSPAASEPVVGDGGSVPA